MSGESDGDDDSMDLETVKNKRKRYIRKHNNKLPGTTAGSEYESSSSRNKIKMQRQASRQSQKTRMNTPQTNQDT